MCVCSSFPKLEFINLVIGLSFLSILSVVDVFTFDKKKAYIPSIITTSYLILAFIHNQAIFLGILGLLLALAMTDLELWSGMADLKAFIGTGMLMGTIGYFFAYLILVASITLIYKYIYKKIVKTKDTLPLLPVFLVCLIIVAVI